jgi:hypothetical protein
VPHPPRPRLPWSGRCGSLWLWWSPCKMSATLPSSLLFSSRLKCGQAEPQGACGSSMNSSAGPISIMKAVASITYVVEAALNYLCSWGRSWLLMPLRPLLITYVAPAQSVYAARASSWSDDGRLLNYMCRWGRSYLLFRWGHFHLLVPLRLQLVASAGLGYGRLLNYIYCWGCS